MYNSAKLIKMQNSVNSMIDGISSLVIISFDIRSGMRGFETHMKNHFSSRLLV